MPSMPSHSANLSEPPQIVGLRDISPQQWKSGIAAWLGWLFDGLDMHLYTLVATPFVAELLAVNQNDTSVGYYGSWIQAAFMVGWALGRFAFHLPYIPSPWLPIVGLAAGAAGVAVAGLWATRAAVVKPITGQLLAG